MRGRTADTPSFGEEALSPFHDPSLEALEARMRAAHRAYIEALNLLEVVRRQATCAACGCHAVSEAGHQRRYDEAEAEKERRRITFRDLCDRLGYVVVEPNIGLGPEDASDCRVTRR